MPPPSPLALFPLTVVLFPGALLPLHIFEPRYRQMLTDAVEGNHRFGILPANGEDDPVPGTVGTVARIRAIQPLPDGRSHIVVSGEERFALQRVVPSDKPYLVGEIEGFDDLPDVQVPSQAEAVALRDLADRYAAALEAMELGERKTDFAADPALLSFQVAALIDWPHPNKHHFLTLRSAMERVTRLIHALPTLVEDAETRAAVHRAASSNGSGPH